MNTRFIGYSSASFILLFIVWILISLLSPNAANGNIETAEDFLRVRSGNQDRNSVNFIFSFLSVCISASLFSGIYLLCRKKSPELAMTGLVFIPAYVVLSIVMYSSMYAIVPILKDLHAIPEMKETVLLLIDHYRSGGENSVSGFHSIPYGLLGISALIFGSLMSRESGAIKIAGILIIISGFGYISGMIRLFSSSGIFSITGGIGGIAYLLSLLIMSYIFLKPGGYRFPEKA